MYYRNAFALLDGRFSKKNALHLLYASINHVCIEENSTNMHLIFNIKLTRFLNQTMHNFAILSFKRNYFLLYEITWKLKLEMMHFERTKIIMYLQPQFITHGFYYFLK